MTSRQLETYVVRYKVRGFGEEEKTAGPYSWKEAQDHFADISGYEGVYDAYVISSNLCQLLLERFKT